jgi:hypothetical protein
MQVHQVAEILASICGLVVAYDNFTGKPRQKRLKDALETWWLKVSYMKWSAFGREEALFAASVIQQIFGTLFSLRRLLICTAIFAALVGATVLSPRGIKELRDLPPAEWKLLCEVSNQEIKNKLGLSSEEIAEICASAQTFELDTEDILFDVIPEFLIAIMMWSFSISITIVMTKGVSRLLTNQSWQINLPIYAGCLLVQLVFIAIQMGITLTWKQRPLSSTHWVILWTLCYPKEAESSPNLGHIFIPYARLLYRFSKATWI